MRPERRQRLAVGQARGDLLAELPAGSSARRRRRTGAASPPSGSATFTRQVALAAELRDRLLGVVERLAVLARLVLDGLDALALLRAGDDRRRLAGRLLGVAVGGLDRVDVVAVDLDRVPAERLGAVAVARRGPSRPSSRASGPSRLTSMIATRLSSSLKAACSNASHIEPSAISESPHRHQTRYGQAVEPLAGQRDADRDRQALAERARSPRRSTAGPASGGPRAGCRACGTSAARRRRSRPAALSTE